MFSFEICKNFKNTYFEQHLRTTASVFQLALLCFHFQKQSPEVSVRKGTLRNFKKFTGKHLCQSLCFNKACNFIKREFMAMVFSCEFFEISMNTFFTEHVWVTASTLSSKRQKSLCKHKLQSLSILTHRKIYVTLIQT